MYWDYSSVDWYTVLFSEDDKEHRNGVGFITKDHIARLLMGFWLISDRSILIKLEGNRSTYR